MQPQHFLLPIPTTLAFLSFPLPTRPRNSARKGKFGRKTQTETRDLPTQQNPATIFIKSNVTLSCGRSKQTDENYNYVKEDEEEKEEEEEEEEDGRVAVTGRRG
ncbi:hypothetical protein E2C01_053425 [Portunus trituberculatus]|uniref:Uncharacterized protein n=1 Tax=Portunus trituberculatus TaxID=210409 RepID=A0A5B7GPE6_PORTR|nr:hypothetical protein [Portunus trituberculatus]